MTRRAILGPRWGPIRRRILDRDGWRCRHCGRPGRLEVDHIRPLWKGGAPYDGDNLQVLCRGCHIRKTRKESKRVLGPKATAWRRLVDSAREV